MLGKIPRFAPIFSVSKALTISRCRKLNKLEIIGFNSMDGFFALTALCVGMLGAIADYLCKRNDFKNLPVDEIPKGKWQAFLPLFVSRTIVGGIGGSLIWIILFDILEHDSISYVRLIFLSFIAGLAAPALISSYQSKALRLLGNDVKNNG